MSRRKLFDQAYDKAARLRPGQESNLTEEEEQVLLAAIRSYDRRKGVALQKFLALLKEQKIDLTYLQGKQLFKQYWAEGRIK